MTIEEKAKKLSVKWIINNQTNISGDMAESYVYNGCMEMAEWVKKQTINKACDAYCEVCDTKECLVLEYPCSWLERYKKKLKKAMEKKKL